MTPSSLNHSFRLIWSDRLQAWVAVAECTAGRGKSRSGRAGRVLRSLLASASLLGAGAVWAADLPTGGRVTSGSATLSQSGHLLTVQQSSQRLVTSWDSFSIAPGSTVRFIQPGASSVALNRVLGAEVSTIQGALQANGQVFLLNPNGVLFSPTARVDTGGLVASTLNLGDADFLAGRYRLSGSSTATVQNQGQIQAPGGTVALLAARVVNEGQIRADRGHVVLGSGQDMTLDVGGPVRLQIDRGALDGLVANGGAIRADGGTVLLTARAADALSSSVINQQGVIQAQTLSTGERGEIVLLGDMGHGTLNAGGRLDASAPTGGQGGFVETSAAQVNTQAGLQVTAGARDGAGGQWLIDPYDYTINATAAGNIASALNSGTSVTVTTQTNNSSYGATASGSGDITVSSAITKSAGGNATLTLRADRNIIVNSAISASAGALGITLSSANNAASTLGGVSINANLSSNGGRILIGGAGGSVTSSQAYGIGYALNSSASTAAVKIGSNVSISSGGGDITINGRSAGTAGGAYTGVNGGVYVLSGATVDTSGGNLFIGARSTGDAKVFAFGLEASSGTTTTFKTSTAGGGIFVDATNDLNALGSLGLTSNGSQARIQFWAPSVAHFLFRLNGSNQAATFTQSPPCHPGYPNCGTMVIPGGNQSYTSAGYNAVSMAMYPIYIFTGSATRTYDGTTDASGLGLSALGGPVGFAYTDLGPLSFSTSSKNVGSYTSLTSSGTNPTTYQSGTYAVAYFNQGTYTITARPINSFSAGNKVYDGTTAAHVTSSDIVNGDAVTVSATGGFTSANVGQGITVNVSGVSLTGADAGNYTVNASGNISTTADITPAPLTITAANASKTYNGLAYSGGNGVSYSGFVNGETASVLGGTLSYGGSAQGATNAGSYAITPAGLTSSNYDISFANGTLSVDPATLTYTASAASRTYGAANPSLSGSVTGFVNGETLASATTGTAAFSTTATGSSHVGSYGITGAGLTANNGNYVFVQDAGNASALSITPATLTYTASSATRTYGAANPALGGTVTGFVNGETLASATTGTASFSTAATSASHVGSYAVNGSGLSANHGNYTFAQAAGNSSALAVTPAALTITANGDSKTYNGLAYSGGNGVSYSGFVNGESDSVLGGTLGYSGSAQGARNAGSYLITPAGLSSSDYNISFASGTLIVNPATLTYTANAASRTYGAVNPALGGSVTGFVNGETLASATTGTAAFSTTASTGSGVGSYGISGSGLTANHGNYVFVQSAGNTQALSITPATLTVTAHDARKTFDGQAYSGGNGVSYSGFVNGESAGVLGGTLSYGGSAQGASNAGTYTITPQGLTAANYTIVFANGSLTVDRAALVAITAALSGQTSKVYDGTTRATLVPGNFVLSGFVGSDGATVTRSAGEYANAQAGTGKLVSTTLQASDFVASGGTDLSNYVLPTSASGSIGTITPASLTVTAADVAKVYDGQAFHGGQGVQFSGFVNGESASVLAGTLSYGGSAQGALHAGSSVILPQGLSSANYDIHYVGGQLLITPATLTLAAQPASRTQGSANPVLGGSVTGFVGNDTLASATTGTLVFTSTADASSAPGSYAVVGSGLSARYGDYVFVQAPGNLDALSVTAPASNADAFLPRTAPVPNFPDNALPALGSQASEPTLGSLNYVPMSSAPTADNAPAAPTSGVAAAPAGAGPAAPAAVGPRAARAGLAGVAVSSANGPLDVFVVDGGINVDAPDRAPAR
ncbi:filamentous hemagglutinin N-terminal domain-containing protein [Ideonella sp. 4Y16]|uniref:MBG domain-containing protein n=1 Tax=Ideonella alba TaxID=2824118 RepID=UPI001B36DE0E|nr:MBG domain-containing protein [Ideonella alba]MBQ0944182.1 filamentous hemagglutinin N-terminal domain-containing protein [Ideonella alba]